MFPWSEAYFLTLAFQLKKEKESKRDFILFISVLLHLFTLVINQEFLFDKGLIYIKLETITVYCAHACHMFSTSKIHFVNSEVSCGHEYK